MRNLMKSMFLCIFFLCLACPNSDDEVDSIITIRNNSYEDLVWFIEGRTPENNSLPQYSPFPTNENIQNRLIEANSSGQTRGSFINLLNDNPELEIKIFLFSRESIETLTWEQIIDDFLVLMF